MLTTGNGESSLNVRYNGKARHLPWTLDNSSISQGA
jgi:hypothetical protein